MPPSNVKNNMERLADAFTDVDTETLEAILEHHGHDYHKAFETVLSMGFTAAAANRERHFVRFVTVQTRNHSEDCVQLSQIIFFSNNHRVPLRDVTNPGGTNPNNEGPRNLMDGNKMTKWLDFKKQPLVMELSNPSVVPDTYVLVTADDVPNRDPVRWLLESSTDGGVTWRTLDDRSRSDQVVTQCRLASTCAFELSTEDEKRLLVRFVTLRTRNQYANCVQLSQILLYANNRPLFLREVTNPNGKNPHNEGPQNIKDESTDSKWLDFRKQPLILELEDSSAIPDSYFLVTANDNPNRDPIRWRVELSTNNGNTWQLLDDRSNSDQDVTLSRSAATQAFGLSKEDGQRPLVRFVTLRTRNQSEDCVQLSQILLYANNRLLPLREVTNPGGRNPHNEGPRNIKDGSTRSKWLDFRKQPLILELEDSSAIPDSYILVTANDMPSRDPIRWRIETSADGGDTWQLLDDRSSSDQDMALSRLAATQVFGTAGITSAVPMPGFATGLSDQEQISHWTSPKTRRPAEFADTLSTICIVPELMGSSYMDDKIATLEKRMRQTPLHDSFETTASRLVGRAFGIANLNRARRFRGSGPGDLASHGNFYQGCVAVYNELDDWQRPLLHMALNEKLEHSPDSLAVMCGLLLRASQECMARKHHVFAVAIDRSVLSEEEMESTLDESPCLETHRQKLYTAAKIHLDELKILAFKSTFTEPTKMYFRAVGDHIMEGDVDVHGSNTYLAVLLASLGVKLAHSPLMDDEVKGVAPFLDGLAPDDIQRLWSTRNLGKSWEAAIGRKSCPLALRRVQHNRFFFHGTTARQVAEDCLIASPRSRAMLKPYLDAFARYFSQEVAVERLCNSFLANDELRPSLQAVFCDIATKEEAIEAEEQVPFWLWDPMIGEFHHKRALALLRSAGICRPDTESS